MKACLNIGTSGWNYKHWRGLFYPENSKASDWFSFYSQVFDTVEINNTFYRLPGEETVKKWESSSPEHFIFAMKANRFITHIKKLHDVGSSLDLFISRARLLKKKGGPLLYQLPPGWKSNKERLEKFLKKLPEDMIHVFEFRNSSWFEDNVFSLLKEHSVSFCIHDMQNVSCPHIVTSSPVYIRFHGYEGAYAGSYSERVLDKWAGYIHDKLAGGKDVYVYFNNDINAYAVKNALTLKGILNPKNSR